MMGRFGPTDRAAGDAFLLRWEPGVFHCLLLSKGASSLLRLLLHQHPPALQQNLFIIAVNLANLARSSSIDIQYRQEDVSNTVRGRSFSILRALLRDPGGRPSSFRQHFFFIDRHPPACHQKVLNPPFQSFDPRCRPHGVLPFALCGRLAPDPRLLLWLGHRSPRRYQRPLKGVLLVTLRITGDGQHPFVPVSYLFSQNSAGQPAARGAVISPGWHCWLPAGWGCPSQPWHHPNVGGSLQG